MARTEDVEVHLQHWPGSELVTVFGGSLPVPPLSVSSFPQLRALQGRGAQILLGQGMRNGGGVAEEVRQAHPSWSPGCWEDPGQPASTSLHQGVRGF